MADVDDIHNAGNQVERQRELLEEADIDDRDRDALQRWVRHRRVHSSSYATHTEIADLSKTRLAAQRADTALVDMGLDDATALFDVLGRSEDRGGHGLSDTALDNYARPLRLFFEWLDAHDDEGDYPWFEQINTSRNSLERYDPEDQLTVSEVEQIRDSASSDNTVRDRAIVAFFADAAVRLSLGGQLRRKHFDLDGDRPTFQPNPDGEGQKGVPVRDYPLFDCVADVRVWLEDHHPDRGNPDAPVWTKEGYDPAEPSEGALSSQRLAGVIRDRVRDAGIEKPANPHNFRHSKIADMRARGYTPDEIQRRVAWKDSVVADMLRVYGRPDDEALLANIDEREGREPPETDNGVREPEPRRRCGNCGLEDIPAGRDRCPRCAEGISVRARQFDAATQSAERDALDALIDEYDTRNRLDDQGRNAVRAMLQSVDAPEQVAPALVKQFSDD